MHRNEQFKDQLLKLFYQLRTSNICAFPSCFAVWCWRRLVAKVIKLNLEQGMSGKWARFFLKPWHWDQGGDWTLLLHIPCNSLTLTTLCVANLKHYKIITSHIVTWPHMNSNQLATATSEDTSPRGHFILVPSGMKKLNCKVLTFSYCSGFMLEMIGKVSNMSMNN